jgi:ABC-2 type transport system permease protein
VRIFRSTLRKLVRRPATWVTFALLVGLLLLIFVAVGATAGQAGDPEAQEAARLLVTFPDAYAFVLGFILGLGGLFAVIYGAAVAGSEWSWGTLKSAVARGESRIGYTLVGYLGVTALAMVGVVLAFLVGIVGAVLGSVLAGVSLDGLGDTSTLGELPEQLARGWLAISMQVAMGFTIATVARSQLAGIGVGIGLYFGESFAGIFLQDIVKFFPFSSANAVLSAGAGPEVQVGGQSVVGLDPNTAILVVIAWLVGALAVASLITERAEIGG